MKRVITFGTFDLFHLGHLSLLERAKNLGDWLVVGVSTDRLNQEKKGRRSVYTEGERMRIVQALRVVDKVFPEESLEQKAHYVRLYNAQILVMGDDWAGRFDELQTLCTVVYLPRTPSISTTATIERIRV